MSTATTTGPLERQLPGASPATPLNTVPRVDLLPPEIGQRNKQLGVQRLLRLVIVLVLVIVLAASGGAWFLATTAQNELATERSTTSRLQGQLLQFSDLQNALDAVALGKAALVVGGSTEVDWQDYLGRVQASLPADVRIDDYSVDASTITSQYPQSDVPLQGARVATLTFTATSPDLPRIPDWLDRLAALPGFVDANPGNVSLDEGTGAYKASISMHIDAQAYSNRVIQETQDESDDAASADDTEEN